MTSEDIFRRIVGALDRAAIPYMLAGAFASAFHGTPRATQDIDLIIRRKERPSSRFEFDRRFAVELFGLRLFIASAVDVVVAKPEWAKAGPSTRQIEDAAGILRARTVGIDRESLERWVHELGLEDEWSRARTMAGTV